MLTSKQRAQLRAMANGLDVILTVGKDGIGDNLVKQADDALEARELIKGKVLENSLLSAREACDELSKRTRSEQVQVIGNLKYDVAVPDGLDAVRAAFSAALARPHPVWLAASTHEGEEAAVIAIHRRLRARWPDLLLLWAPRHPERFARVQALAAEAGWKVGTRRGGHWPRPDDDVFVIDTLGELMAFYGCADVAFVGGSLQPIGGHNLLEPAAVGTAVVTGPHLHNFAEISRRMDEAGALRIGEDADAVAAALEALLADPGARRAMVEAGTTLIEQGQGALQRTLALVAADLPASAEEIAGAVATPS